MGGHKCKETINQAELGYGIKSTSISSPHAQTMSAILQILHMVDTNENNNKDALKILKCIGTEFGEVYTDNNYDEGAMKRQKKFLELHRDEVAKTLQLIDKALGT